MEELQDDHHAHVTKQLLDDAVFVCVWRGSCSGGKGDVTCRFTGPAGWSYLASQHITCGMIGIPPDTVNRVGERGDREVRVVTRNRYIYICGGEGGWEKELNMSPTLTQIRSSR